MKPLDVLRPGLCNHNGGQGIGAGHVCRCERPIGHPLDCDRPHFCECGALWGTTEPEDRYGELTVLCGKALLDHYADRPWQPFHHAPSVAAVALDAVPDGWAKVDGEWVQIETANNSTCEHGNGRNHDCTDCDVTHYRAVRHV